MNNQTIPIAIIIAGVIIAGAVVYSKNPGSTGGLSGEPGAGQAAPTEQAPVDLVVDNEEDHIRGNLEAPVTIVEFSDFQCPFCGSFHPTVQQILDDYPEQVRWVYKHYPLGFHEQAQGAAEASECSAEQGKFWEFADSLFENQSQLGETLYTDLAQEIGLEMSQFEECVSSRKYKSDVDADLSQGNTVGVRGTPGSFVNGEVIPGAVPYDFLKAAVERALSNL